MLLVSVIVVDVAAFDAHSIYQHLNGEIDGWAQTRAFWKICACAMFVSNEDYRSTFTFVELMLIRL